jgi:hypothetical protein
MEVKSMIEKYFCGLDKKDYFEIEMVRDRIVLETVNFHDDNKLDCALVSLSKEQVKDLIIKLTEMVK